MQRSGARGSAQALDEFNSRGGRSDRLSVQSYGLCKLMQKPWVGALRERLANGRNDEAMAKWRATVGAFRDDPGFEEMVALGREYRASLDVKPKRKATKKRRGAPR